MSDARIRAQLTLKPVTLRHLDQFDELLRYVFQVTRQDLVEGGYEEGELTRAKRPVLKRAEVIGWFTPEDQLVSQLAIYPCQVNIHGRIFKMGGITGVGTYPEYANFGLMSDLIREALLLMRQNEQFISYLYPYSIPYYRRKGWEIMSDHITYELKDTQLPAQHDVPGMVERLPVDDEDVKATYDTFARRNHGALLRGPLEWDEYWRWNNEEEYTAAVYYNKAEEPTGSMIYTIAKDVFKIREMIYFNQEARQGLFNFMTAHFSMIDIVKGNTYRNEPIAFLLEDGQIEERIEPYYMARIVDVEAFLRAYPYARPVAPFHFVVTDPLAAWNNGIFGVLWSDEGNVHIVHEPVGARVEVSIQTLSSMMMSYRRPTYFYEIERLHADPEAVEALEDCVPDQQPYFSDYF